MIKAKNRKGVVSRHRIGGVGRRLLSIVLVLTFLVATLPTEALAVFVADDLPWKGSGTKDDPYLISSKDDLWALSNCSNSGENLTGTLRRRTLNLAVRMNRGYPFLQLQTDTAYVETDDKFINNIGGITSKNEGGYQSLCA